MLRVYWCKENFATSVSAKDERNLVLNLLIIINTLLLIAHASRLEYSTHGNILELQVPYIFIFILEMRIWYQWCNSNYNKIKCIRVHSAKLFLRYSQITLNVILSRKCAINFSSSDHHFSICRLWNNNQRMI